MEYNYANFYICVLVNLLSWLALVSYRESLDLIIAGGLININAMSWVYMSGQVGEMQDPDRAYTFLLQAFILIDLISTWLQVLSTQRLKVLQNNTWCLFGKSSILFYLMTMFEDRQPLIVGYFAVSCLTTFTQSCAMVRLIQEYESQQTVLDWFKMYIRLVLDVKFNLESVHWYFTQEKEIDFVKYD